MTDSINASKDGIINLASWCGAHNMHLDVAVDARDALAAAVNGGSLSDVHNALENARFSVGVTMNF